MSSARPDPKGGDFWSRRRAAVAREEQESAAAQEAVRERAEREALEDKPDDEILAELNLPDPDTLQQGDDFSAFLKAQVPDRIRRRALRRLWRSNPVLANVDSLVDYGEDFTDSARVIENMQTAYQVGKGMLKHVEAQLAKLEDPPPETSRAADDERPEPPETRAMTAEVDAKASDEVPAVPGNSGSNEPEDTAPRSASDQGDVDALPQALSSVSPRRMRFVYARTPEENQ